jgi:hypothetical protein
MQIDKEDIEATYNKATGWLSILFPCKPDYEVLQGLKAQGFRYEPYSRRWRASFTTWREDHLKALAGKVTEIDIKPNYEAKAEYAENMAAKHEVKADQEHKTAEKMFDVIPFGQPILVGHYSENGDRNYRNRAISHYDKSSEETKKAEYYQERAERLKAKSTESPGLIYRRIQKLEADKRKMERELKAGETEEGTIYYQGHISEKRKEEIKRWIDFYNSRLAIEQEKYKASGGIATDNQQFKSGDIVYTRHGIGIIATISKKTLRIKLDGWGIYTNSKGESLLSIDDIKQKLTPEQIEKYKEALAVKAAQEQQKPKTVWT